MNPQEQLQRLALLERTGQYDIDMIRNARQQVAKKAKSSEEKDSNFLLDLGFTTAGGAGGVAGGAAAGAAAGSFIPGIGTVIGGGIGALLGGALGSGGGKAVSNAIQGRAIDEGVMGEAAWGALGGVGKVAKGVNAIRKGSDYVDAYADVLRGGKTVKNAGKATKGMGVLNTVAEGAKRAPARMFAKAFTVPTKLAGRLKPVDTAEEILQHGFKIQSLDDMKRVAGQITGQNGIMSRGVRSIVGRIPKEVKTDNVVTSVKSMLDDIPDLTDTEAQKIMNTVIKAQKPGKLPGTMNALDAFDNIKHLEDMGYQYINSSTYLTKNLKNEQIGKALLAGADELKIGIDQAVDAFDLIEEFKSPAVLEEIRKISPRLADQVSEAKNIGDLRKVQAPFVRLGQMVNLTEEAAQSVGGGFASGVGGRAVGGAAGFMAGGPVGAAAGMVASPLLEGVEQATRAPIASGGASAINAITKRLPSKTGGVVDDAAKVVDNGVMANAKRNLPAQAGLQLMDGSNNTPQPVDNSVDNAAGMGVLSPLNAGTFDGSGSPVPGGVSGFTPEMFQQYALMDMAQTGGKYIDVLEKIYEISNPGMGGDLSANQQQSLIKLETADNIVGRIESQLAEVGLGSGPVGKLQGKFKNVLGSLGVNTDAEAYNKFRSGVATQLAKALGESGNMSDNDIKRALDLIPSLDTSSEAAQKNLAELRAIIADNRQSIYSVGGGSSAGSSELGVLTQLLGAAQ